MLLLLLKIGQDRYALPANRMIEVVPLVSLKKIPQALPGVAGIFNYHGQPVPVIDLSDLTIGMPCQPRVSTRIILVNYPDAAGQKQILGLMAEQASETIQRGKADLFYAGNGGKTGPYFGLWAMAGGG